MKFKPRVAFGFRTGVSNEPFAVDGPHLTDLELETIQNFMEDVANGRTLVGKNKPSWVDDNYDKIPGSDNYEQEITGTIIAVPRGILTPSEIILLT